MAVAVAVVALRWCQQQIASACASRCRVQCPSASAMGEVTTALQAMQTGQSHYSPARLARPWARAVRTPARTATALNLRQALRAKTAPAGGLEAHRCPRLEGKRAAQTARADIAATRERSWRASERARRLGAKAESKNKLARHGKATRKTWQHEAARRRGEAKRRRDIANKRSKQRWQ